jgi:hypothetical protein
MAEVHSVSVSQALATRNEARGPDSYAFPPGGTYLLPDHNGDLRNTMVSAGIKQADYQRILDEAAERRREVYLERDWS